MAEDDDVLPILHSVDGKFATKRFSRHPKTGKLRNKSYDNAYHFRVELRPVDSFDDLAAALEYLARQPHAFVIRGAPLPDTNLHYTKRRFRPHGGEPATFGAAARRWFATDMDHIPAPAGTDPVADPSDAADYLRGLLPPEMHDTRCVCQFTSSQSLPRDDGMLDNEYLSARLWFRNAVALSDADLKRWAAHHNQHQRVIDPALYHAIQAHYTCAPIFEDGMTDPLPQRLVVLRGLDDEVSLIIPPADPKHPELAAEEGWPVGLGVAAYLAEIGGRKGFHEPIKSAVASFVAIYGSAADAADLKKEIRTAIDAADPGGRDRGKIERYKSDAFLDGIISGIRKIHGDRPPKGWTQPPPPYLDEAPPAEPDDDELSASDPVPASYEELIASFNRRYAVANETGKAIVFEPVMDPVRHRTVLIRIRFEDLRKFYLNRTLTVVVVDPKTGAPTETTKTHAEWWLASPRRRQFLGGVVFDPTNTVPRDYWNLWSGFTVIPAPGDWGLMQDHIWRVICGGDEALAEYLLNYIARMFQEPDKPGEVAVVLRGRRGAGKGILLNWLWRAWGQHGVHISNAKHLVGNFNSHLRDCVMLFADEAFFAGDRAHEGVLKALITEPSLPIEGKYQNLVEVPNMLHIFISSNADWVVPAAIDERRFCVADVADNRVGDRAYFADIAAQMQGGGLAALIWDMLHRDITGFEVRDIPATAALKTQKTLTLGSLERWWHAVLSRGFLWKSKHGTPWFRAWHEFYTTELLMRSYLQWCGETRPYDRKRREQLGRFFAETYAVSRPRGLHPGYEIDSIDRRETHEIVSPAGTVIQPGRPLDDVAIVNLEHSNGYHVGDLEAARARFLEMCDVDADWRLPIDQDQAQNQPEE
jgi:hypothetical protein